ncbi:hypothetical protein B1812_15105 [Methylocystis bryophila]|uniref:Uncharacterized protein n=1 Tax=Methylocystis bryophila TaxID=655015 RepID=A0A1W6MX92_9HYPH|nr:hypothetical protein B1812_15105 [Methylocystis bryophila]
MRALSRPTRAPTGGGAWIGVAPILALCLCASASAEPVAKSNHCAVRGPDYAPVAGGERCVRIGEHVRADMAHKTESAPAPLMGNSGGLARAVADGVKGVSDSLDRPAAPDARLYRR